MSLDSSSEFFINVKNPPTYDGTKHFFDQSKDVIQFYQEEKKKITEGITIGGVFIHPWLYYHINFFKTPIPQENKEEIITTPTLRDNEWYVAENLQEASRRGMGLAFFGSRRFSKSTIEASYISWTNLLKENGVTEIVGGDEGDLSQLSHLLKTAFNNINPALYIPRIKNDWSSKIIFGVKDKAGEEMVYSQISIKNANEGKSRSSEKGAGLSPVGFVIDEFGKFNFLPFFQGAIPSFETEYGWKLVPMLAGTGGNKELSKDAMRLLSNPEAYGIIPMNWDTLENKIEDKDLITWKKSTFGTYIPAQMSLMTGIKKKQSNLANYLKVDNKELEGIDIKITDWKQAKEVIEDKRLQLKKDRAALQKNKMYYPLDPEECFLNRFDNPFEAKIAKAHRDDLIAKGKTGKAVELSVTGGRINYTLSDKDRIPYPFDGGTHDAPVFLYDTDLPEIKPPYGQNVGGLDPYKQVKSGTDSVGSFYILSRFDPLLAPCERIVASYASRPNSIEIFNRNCELLAEAFGAEILMENADQSFIQYLDGKNKADIILAEGVDLSKSINPNSNPNTRYGLYPTERNKDYLLKLVISYCNKLHELGRDEDGNPILKYGVEYIDDIDLLQEIIDYKPGENVDRITAFGHALAWARRLDSMNIMPEPGENGRGGSKPHRPPVNRRPNKYSRHRSNPYK